MRNPTLPSFLIVLMLVLLSTGVAYAHWSQTLYISGSVATSSLDWEFESVTPKDVGLDWTCDSSCDPPSITNIRQLDKDVGSSTWDFVDTDADGDNDKLIITVDNAYPCYYNHFDFWVHNNGSVPLKIESVIINGHEFTGLFILCLDLGGDEENDIIVRWGNNFGVQIEFCESLNISFDFHILQGAPQGETLSFTIELVAEQCL